MGQWSAAVFSFGSVLVFALVLVLRLRKVTIQEHDQVHFATRRVAIGNQVLGRWAIFWKPEIRERVWQAALRDVATAQAQLEIADLKRKSMPALNASKAGLSFLAGFVEGNAIDFDLAKLGPHALVIGATGTGKSQFLRHLLTSVQSSYGTDAALTYLIDYKGGAGLRQFSTYSNCQAFSTDLDQNLIEVLDQVLEQMRSRQLALAQDQVANWRRILVVVDEFGAALAVPNALAKFEAILARGRSLGVHLVAAHQSTAGIPRQLMVNFALRLALGRIDAVDAAQLGFGALRKSPNQPLKSSQLISAQVLTNDSQFELFFVAPDLPLPNAVPQLLVEPVVASQPSEISVILSGSKRQLFSSGEI